VLAFPNELFFGSLFWLVVLLALVWGFFLIMRMFSSSENMRQFVRNRVVYSTVRVLLFAYFPFAVFTTYTFTLSNSKAAIVVAALFFSLVHGGFLAFIYWILPRDKRSVSKLFSPSYLNKFGCLYSSFYYRRCWFMIIVLLRKLIFGIIVGVVSNQAGQLGILLGVETLYFLILMRLKPYLDHLHMFLDCLTTVFHIIVIGFMFAFLDSLNSGKTIHLVVSVLVVIFLLLSFVVCIAVYISSWLKMKNIHSIGQLISRCRGKDNNDPAKDRNLKAGSQVSMSEDIELSVEEKLD